MKLFLVYMEDSTGIYDETESAVVIAESGEQAIECLLKPEGYTVESSGEVQAWLKHVRDGNVVFEQPLYVNPKADWRAVEIGLDTPKIVLGHIHYG